MMHPGDFTPGKLMYCTRCCFPLLAFIARLCSTHSCFFLISSAPSLVCTTELGRAASLTEEFTKRGVKLCGFSCNDAKSHNEWIKDIEVVTGGKVEFPLFCDPKREAATQLGILDQTNKDAKGMPLTVRSVFIVKPDRTIALMMTYPASTGRNFVEIIRCIDSLQLTAVKSVATPVDWVQGNDVIVNFPLTNAMADEKFGVGGWRTVDVPSESGKDLTKNYLRYTQLS
jgi:alkyl hydroperoxide reductase subunit AhpC